MGGAQKTLLRINEYFVPREGIDRDVISADICLYLGNNALVRPGSHEVCVFKGTAVVLVGCLPI